MPVNPTYPGVYIEEIPSGVRTITGVATSITAFVGWAPRGQTDSAVLVTSWADYERKFGGLDPRSYLGYAVAQFFVNGGSLAYIIRLAAANAVSAAASVGGLTLQATGQGAWANVYQIGIKRRTDPGVTDHFRLQVIDNTDNANPIVLESFDNLSMDATNPRFVASVVNDGSAFVNATVGNPTDVPSDGTTSLTGGVDGDVLMPNDPAFHAAMDVDGAGLDLLEPVDLFNMLVVPGESDAGRLAALQATCKERRAMLIADCASDATFASLQNGPPSGLIVDASTNAAFYFPWVEAPDAMLQGRKRAFPPSGFIAGIYARTDSQRGVWKAPAGIDASLTTALGVTQRLNDLETGELNIRAVNVIRNFPVYGTVAWGARTLHGNNERGSEWKYIPVRRTALYIEESLYRGLKWVVFEPNDEPLWAQIRLNVGGFMHNLFRQGAFQGSSPKDAYFVKCDKETTTQNDINLGIVNIIVGFAPLKPAEFVIVKIQQMAGQLEA